MEPKGWTEYLLIYNGKVALDKEPQSFHRRDWDHIADMYRVLVDRDDFKVFASPTTLPIFGMWAWIPSENV